MAVLAGWMAQGAAPAERLPWLLSLPLACAILPSIILAGIPDREADLQVGKGTLAVRLGARGAALVALGAAGAAALLALAAPAVVPAFGGLAWFALPHALLLAWLVVRRRGALHGRIDALLVASLTFMVWFVLVPLVNLW
jgi:4-hydroxybenzoate polyprenyltransferase